MNLYTFENHFRGNDTIIIGDYIINGCQNFHISEIHEKCHAYDVPDRMKEEVLLQHSKMKCYNLVEHVNHKNVDVRISVAKQGYGLDILVNDESRFVRSAVAKQGYGLDILVNDESRFVRYEVAKQGYGLDILVNDKHIIVRYEVSKQGYGLDILINDENEFIRYEVAKQGYGLDILRFDPSTRVMNCVINKRLELLNEK